MLLFFVSHLPGGSGCLLYCPAAFPQINGHWSEQIVVATWVDCWNFELKVLWDSSLFFSVVQEDCLWSHAGWVWHKRIYKNMFKRLWNFMFMTNQNQPTHFKLNFETRWLSWFSFCFFYFYVGFGQAQSLQKFSNFPPLRIKAQNPYNAQMANLKILFLF